MEMNSFRFSVPLRNALKRPLPVNGPSCYISMFEPEEMSQSVVNHLVNDGETWVWPQTAHLCLPVLSGTGTINDLPVFCKTPMLTG